MSYSGSTASANPPITSGDFTLKGEVPGGAKEYLADGLSRGQNSAYAPLLRRVLSADSS